MPTQGCQSSRQTMLVWFQRKRDHCPSFNAFSRSSCSSFVFQVQKILLYPLLNNQVSHTNSVLAKIQKPNHSITASSGCSLFHIVSFAQDHKGVLLRATPLSNLLPSTHLLQMSLVFVESKSTKRWARVFITVDDPYCVTVVRISPATTRVTVSEHNQSLRL